MSGGVPDLAAVLTLVARGALVTLPGPEWRAVVPWSYSPVEDCTGRLTEPAAEAMRRCVSTRLVSAPPLDRPRLTDEGARHLARHLSGPAEGIEVHDGRVVTAHRSERFPSARPRSRPGGSWQDTTAPSGRW